MTWRRGVAGTYNRDTVTTNAGVALEDDVTALVDSEAVILVHDCTGKATT